MTGSKKSSEDRVTAAAEALRKEAGAFRDPVHFYVDKEAIERWEAANPRASVYDTPDIDWELESWKILARAALDAVDAVD